MALLPKYIVITLRIVISAALLGVAVWMINPDELKHIFANTQLLPFIIATLFLCLATFICAWRWWAVSKAIGLSLSYKNACTEYFGCTFFNHVLPGGIVGDIARAWRHSSEKGLTKSAHSVIAERLMGQSSFILFIICTIPIILASPELENRYSLIGFFAVVIGCYLIAAFLIITGKHIPGKLGTKIHEFHDALFDLGLKNACKMIFLSILMVICFVLAFYFTAQALKLTVPFALLIGSVPLLKSTMMLPISVGGWGVREGTAGAIWAIVGMPAQEGVAISITYGLAFIISSLPGALFWSDLDNDAWQKSA